MFLIFFTDKKEVDENPYEEPIDAVTTSEVNLLNRATPLNDDYATIEEYIITELPLIVEEPTYEVLLVHNIPEMI
jgi:hypothetical protein